MSDFYGEYRLLRADGKWTWHKTIDGVLHNIGRTETFDDEPNSEKRVSKECRDE